jgi:hypothetical protein
MSSVVNPQSEPPNHDELVAYLDGELAPEDCRAVEERLANDAAFRQQLRDLDQAWEALGALPSTAVDDGFARTTIELACVAAEEDLSHRKVLAAVENRSRTRWWIAGGVAAAVIGFMMVRALAVHRNNMLLADLPVIEQVNALSHTRDVDFLRKLSKAVPAGEFVNDNKPTFDRTLAEFTNANAATLAERHAWVDSLAGEQKADLADRARAFEDLRQKPAETDRLRKLVNEINRQPDAPALRETLVAYGQWLSPPRHSGGEQQQLNDHWQTLSADEQIEDIQRLVQSENEQAARQLSKEDQAALRREIIEIAKEKRAEWLGKLPKDVDVSRIPNLDANNLGPALYILREAMRNEKNGEATVDRLLSKLSREANDHWNKLPAWRPDKKLSQLSEWIHESIKPKWKPEDLERFFTSDKLSNDKRQELLNMPRSKMDAELERLYLKSELQIDDRWPLWREFGEGMRGPRNGPPGLGPPEGGRPPAGRSRRPDGPPPQDFGPDGRRRETFDRERDHRPGPGGRQRRPSDDRQQPEGTPPDQPDQHPPPLPPPLVEKLQQA